MRIITGLYIGPYVNKQRVNQTKEDGYKEILFLYGELHIGFKLTL